MLTELGISIESDFQNHYELQMLENNQYKYLLPSRLQRHNHTIKIYYDISGREVLCEGIKPDSLDYHAVRDILYRIDGMCKEAQEYLLPLDGLLLQPDALYVNERGESLQGCYLPGRKEPIALQLQTFIEFLMLRIKHRDKRAVEFIYGLYNILNGVYTDLEMVMQYIRMPKEEPENSKENVETISYEQEYYDLSHIQPSLIERDWENRKKESANRNIRKWTRVEAREKLQFVVLTIGIIISVGIEISMVQKIIYAQALDRDWLVCILAGITILFSGYCMLQLLKNKQKNQNNHENQEEEALHKKKEENTENNKMNPMLASATQLLQLEDRVIGEGEEEIGTKLQIQLLEDGIGTILYTVNTSGTILGRQQDIVDICIANASVSRKHARIYLDFSEWFLEDMGSTNGCYVNATKLERWTPIAIKERDILRVGNVEFMVYKEFIGR